MQELLLAKSTGETSTAGKEGGHGNWQDGGFNTDDRVQLELLDVFKRSAESMSAGRAYSELTSCAAVYSVVQLACFNAPACFFLTNDLFANALESLQGRLSSALQLDRVRALLPSLHISRAVDLSFDEKVHLSCFCCCCC